MRPIISLLLLLNIFVFTNGYKILVVSQMFGHSHANFMGRLADVLTERGHNVTVLMPVVRAQELKRPGVYLTKDKRTMMPSERTAKLADKLFDSLGDSVWYTESNPINGMKMASAMAEVFESACDDSINQSHLLEDLKNERFEIGIAEPFYFCGFGLLEHLQIPVTIAAESAVQFDTMIKIIGEPIMASFVPNALSSSTDKMNFLERVGNVIGSYLSTSFFDTIYRREYNQFVKRFGANFRHYEDIMADVSYVFTSGNPYLNFPRPLNHKTIEIGGITFDKGSHHTKKPLDEKWDKILSERAHTVLLSFGSVAKSNTMPDDYKNTLLEVFGELNDVTFIWKYEEESDFANHVPNVHLCKWVPQVALLNDDRLDLFITHGGLGSTAEVAYVGKPAIFVPMFADQPRNAAMLSKYNVSLLLQKTDLNKKDVVKKAIETVLQSKKFKENAVKLADILQNSPVNPTETFIKYVEFAGKVGRIPNIDSYSRHLNFFQLHMIDVVAFLFGCSLVVISVASYAVLRFLRIFLKKKAKVE